MKYIIWDWNGTLFNDVDICIDSMNHLLQKNNLSLIENESAYRSLFTFPVKEYYGRLGFDFERTPFEELAHDFITRYQELSLDCALSEHVEEVLYTLSNKDYKQIVLSASKSENLLEQMKQFNISHYFEKILGLDDIYASTKTEMARQWKIQSKPEEITVIGDTRHDLHVAEAIQGSCILYSQGHQHIPESRSGEYSLVHDLSRIPDFL